MKSLINVSGRVDESFKEIAKEVSLNVIKLMKQPDCFEVTIKFVSENEIRRLNSEFRNIDKVTDVLSFPATNLKAGEIYSKNKDNFFVLSDDELCYLGDMAICLKRLREQAKEYGVTDKSELKKLVIHSILHLLGYDHIEDEDFEIMNEKENLLDKKIII